MTKPTYLRKNLFLFNLCSEALEALLAFECGHLGAYQYDVRVVPDTGCCFIRVLDEGHNAFAYLAQEA